jgi:hypothetical protein
VKTQRQDEDGDTVALTDLGASSGRAGTDHDVAYEPLVAGDD